MGRTPGQSYAANIIPLGMKQSNSTTSLFVSLLGLIFAATPVYASWSCTYVSLTNHLMPQFFSFSYLTILMSILVSVGWVNRALVSRGRRTNVTIGWGLATGLSLLYFALAILSAWAAVTLGNLLNVFLQIPAWTREIAHSSSFGIVPFCFLAILMYVVPMLSVPEGSLLVGSNAKRALRKIMIVTIIFSVFDKVWSAWAIKLLPPQLLLEVVRPHPGEGFYWNL
jgi:hypothetical protein